MSLINEKYNKVLFMFFAILPIIDSANGLLVRNYDFSLGTLYKMMLIFFIIGRIFYMHNFSIKQFIFAYRPIIFPLFYIIVTVVINLFLFDVSPFWDMIIKVIFNIVLFYSLYYLVNEKLFDSFMLSKILYTQSIIIILCLLIPFLLGTGYYSYAGNLGYKGFFYSQNELNATLLILFYYNIYIMYQKINIKQFVITFLLTICLILMSSKSSILGCILGWGFFIVFAFKKKKNVINKQHIILFIIVLFVVSILVLPLISDFLVRQSTLFNNFSGDIISTITSGRNLFIRNAWANLSTDSSFILKLFIGNGFASTFLIEMDLIDIFFYLGLVGVALVTYWIIVYVRLFRKNDNNNFRFIGLTVILLFSFFTGHIVFTATASTYFVMYCLENIFVK